MLTENKAVKWVRHGSFLFWLAASSASNMLIQNKPEYPEKSPDDVLQKMPHTKAKKIQAPADTRTCTVALVAG